jgi:hypothetical protein
VENHLDQLVHALLKKSYDFMLLGAKFEEYALNKPGMNKLYKGISDKAWKDTIDLIKYQTKRGHKVRFNTKYDHLEEKTNNKSFADLTKSADNTLVKSIVANDLKNSGQNVLKSLAYTLDYEKNLAVGIHHIHRLVSIAGKKDHSATDVSTHYHYDPEVTQYLEEKFLEDESEHIRKLAGYVTDVKKLLLDGVAVKDFAMEAFDNYLVQHQ